ncbi:MAG: type VI secretion system membrane subunit TssM, partial [Alphaproteobacteria bacterium GM202ARS2]|nr:type VI secretion system membrane subunit TssM [Alphaproteobacteria bacterium GM202ARS2]
DTSSRPWRPRATNSSPARISRQGVKAFEIAADIRDLFFSAGDQPTYHFVLSPVFLDSSVSKFQLELGGDQRLAYRHGPVRPRQLSWPGPIPLGGARVVFTTFDPNVPPASYSVRGFWGWFRLLDRFGGRSGSATATNAIYFELNGLRATYALNPMISPNVDALRLFADFECPLSL